MDFTAIIISFIALILSVFQFFIERRVNRKESTINAFAELQKEVLNDQKHFETDIDEPLKKHEQVEQSEKDCDWKTFSEYLARIEQFSVGINTKVYSIKIVDRMAGSYMIKEYNRLVPIINYKRIKGNTNKWYEEFEKMVTELKKYNPDIVLKEAIKVK